MHAGIIAIRKPLSTSQIVVCGLAREYHSTINEDSVSLAQYHTYALGHVLLYACAVGVSSLPLVNACCTQAGTCCGHNIYDGLYVCDCCLTKNHNKIFLTNIQKAL